MVTYKTPSYKVPPQDLLNRIQSIVIRESTIRDWGTRRLAVFLDELMSDTRGNTRTGFDHELGSVLLTLSLANAKAMEDLGEEEFQDSRFGSGDMWKLPKNF